MLSKSSNTLSFQEISADLRMTCIGTGLASPTEILHQRNLVTKAQTEIDIKAIRSLLLERQLKMTLAHDLSKRAKKARLLVVGERCYVLGLQNKWTDAFITGITDRGRSYDTQVEVTGCHLRRNRTHIRPRSPDVRKLHASFLQKSLVPSATTDTNTLSKRENSVISEPKQLAESGSKTVLSEPCKGSIKQTNTSQVLVSETVPPQRVQLSRQAKKTRFGDNPVSSTVTIPARQPRCNTSTRNRRKFKLDVTDPDLLIPIKQTRANERHSTDLREPQPSSSDSQSASLQPVSETTTSESSVSLPSSPSGKLKHRQHQYQWH